MLADPNKSPSTKKNHAVYARRELKKLKERMVGVDLSTLETYLADLTKEVGLSDESILVSKKPKDAKLAALLAFELPPQHRTNKSSVRKFLRSAKKLENSKLSDSSRLNNAVYAERELAKMKKKMPDVDFGLFESYVAEARKPLDARHEAKVEAKEQMRLQAIADREADEKRRELEHQQEAKAAAAAKVVAAKQEALRKKNNAIAAEKAAVARRAMLEKKMFPKPKVNDPAFERIARQAFKSTGWNEKILGVAVSQPNWNIKRKYGRIIGRTRGVKIGVRQKSGECNLYDFTVYQQYDGKKYFGARRYSHGTAAILCKNIK